MGQNWQRLKQTTLFCNNSKPLRQIKEQAGAKQMAMRWIDFQFFCRQSASKAELSFRSPRRWRGVKCSALVPPKPGEGGRFWSAGAIAPLFCAGQ
jgi:hypothetical protein